MKADVIIKVWCMDCGRRGVVSISSSGKILSKDWWYWGKMNIASLKTSKYLYELLFDKNGKILTKKNGNITTRRIFNTDYDKRIKPKMVEIWSHAKCVKESVKEQKEREKRFNRNKERRR